jgi:hypothetical protein
VETGRAKSQRPLPYVFVNAYGRRCLSQIGTLVEAPRHLQDTTLTREKQYRPGQLVQSLTKDEDTGSYAKRKYGDLQSKRMENGRGNGWKKQRGWKP